MVVDVNLAVRIVFTHARRKPPEIPRIVIGHEFLPLETHQPPVRRFVGILRQAVAPLTVEFIRKIPLGNPAAGSGLVDQHPAVQRPEAAEMPHRPGNIIFDTRQMGLVRRQFEPAQRDGIVLIERKEGRKDPDVVFLRRGKRLVEQREIPCIRRCVVHILFEHPDTAHPHSVPVENPEPIFDLAIGLPGLDDYLPAHHGNFRLRTGRTGDCTQQRKPKKLEYIHARFIINIPVIPLSG